VRGAHSLGLALSCTNVQINVRATCTKSQSSQEEPVVSIIHSSTRAKHLSLFGSHTPSKLQLITLLCQRRKRQTCSSSGQNHRKDSFDRSALLDGWLLKCLCRQLSELENFFSALKKSEQEGVVQFGPLSRKQRKCHCCAQND